MAKPNPCVSHRSRAAAGYSLFVQPPHARAPPLSQFDAAAGAGGGGGGWDEGEGEGEHDEGGGATALARAGGGGGSGAIVLHEDRKLYPDADEVYPGAETLVQDEDTQPLSKPIVAPVEVRAFSASEEAPPATGATPSFLASLMGTPARVRNVALVGHLHHGKTTLADLLIESTLAEKWDPAATPRYTDARGDEQDRGVSVKATPFSVVVSAGGAVGCGRSFLLNCVDAPGHPDFSDELCAAVRLCDGALLAVDAVEGVMMATERAVRAAVAEGAPLVLCVTKVDRLILDLRLPPADAYYKLVHLVAEVNACVAAATPGGSPQVLSPLDGTVVFAGALHGWSFSLETLDRKSVV